METPINTASTIIIGRFFQNLKQGHLTNYKSPLSFVRKIEVIDILMCDIYILTDHYVNQTFGFICSLQRRPLLLFYSWIRQKQNLLLPVSDDQGCHSFSSSSHQQYCCIAEQLLLNLQSLHSRGLKMLPSLISCQRSLSVVSRKYQTSQKCSSHC